MRVHHSNDDARYEESSVSFMSPESGPEISHTVRSRIGVSLNFLSTYAESFFVVRGTIRAATSLPCGCLWRASPLRICQLCARKARRCTTLRGKTQQGARACPSNLRNPRAAAVPKSQETFTGRRLGQVHKITCAWTMPMQA